MGDWKEYRFSDLLVDDSISYGIVQPGTHKENDSVPVIRVNNIKDGNIITKDILKVDKAIEEKYNRTRLKGGELLITVVGSIGECAIVPDHLKGWNVARAVSVARIKAEYDVNFIKYSFKTEDMIFQMYGNTNDTVQPTLNLSELKSLIFRIPSLPLQKVIASILSSLDDKIGLLYHQNDTLEKMAEMLFRQWFVEEAKEEWILVKVSDVALINKSNISKGFPFVEIEYLDTGSITKGRIESFQKYNLDKAPSRAQRLVDDNDIVYSLVRPIQRHYGLLQDVKPNTIVSTGFCVISCVKITPFFIYMLLTQNETVDYFDMVAEGSTSAYPSLKPSDISEFEFQIPPQKKLEEFHEIAESNWRKIKLNNNKIRILSSLRDTLLPKLMSGEVKVNLKGVGIKPEKELETKLK